MAAVHKKHEIKPEAKSEEKPVVVSDTVIETTERIEVIEEVTPGPKSEVKTSEESAPAAAPSAASSDPLTEFKEKMIEEEQPSSFDPTKKNFMWPILFIFIIALLLLGGIFVYKNNTKGEKVNVVTLSPTPTIMPQPTKAIDLSKYPIKILNGSGVAGEASRQKTNLEAEGFTVASVGNADNSDHTGTIIQAKKEVDKAYLNKLKSVLEKSFVVGEVEELSEDSDSNVIIIIGSETN